MKQIYLLILAAALFVGCTKELNENTPLETGAEMVDITITVDNVGAQAEKLVLVSGKQPMWQPGDQITVVTTNESGKVSVDAGGYTFTYTGTEASASGSFSGAIPAGVTPMYAVYPATSKFASVKRNSIYTFDSFEIPSVQYAVKDGIKGEYLIEYGAITGSAGSYSVSMKSVCSVIKIVVPSDLTDVADITLRSALCQPVSGHVAPATDNTLTALEYYPEVSLRNEDGSNLEPGNYYLTVFPTLPNNNKFADGETNYGKSRITFTRKDGIAFSKTFSEEPLVFEPNTVYALNFYEKMNRPLRTQYTVNCSLQAMADVLKAGNHLNDATKTTEDVTVLVDTFKFVLKSYIPKTGYTNGWYTDGSAETGDLRVRNANRQGSTKKGGYAMIQVPAYYGKAKLVYVRYGNTSSGSGSLLSYKCPYDASPAGPRGTTPSLSCPTTGESYYNAFWTLHSEATEIYLASYTGGNNAFSDGLECVYEVKYREPEALSGVSVENLGSVSDYKF